MAKAGQFKGDGWGWGRVLILNPPLSHCSPLLLLLLGGWGGDGPGHPCDTRKPHCAAKRLRQVLRGPLGEARPGDCWGTAEGSAGPDSPQGQDPGRPQQSKPSALSHPEVVGDRGGAERNTAKQRPDAGEDSRGRPQRNTDTHRRGFSRQLRQPGSYLHFWAG